MHVRSISRRRMLGIAGASLTLPGLCAIAAPLLHSGADDAVSSRQPAPGERRYSVRLAGGGDSHDAVLLHTWSDGAWQLRQELPVEGARLLLGPDGGTHLLAARHAASIGLPAGQVSLLHIHPRTGMLTLLGSQSLALAQRKPMAMAVAPGRRLLAVAAQGGIISLLPLADDGRPEPVIAVHKNLALARRSPSSLQLRFASGDHLSAHAEGESFLYRCDEQGSLRLATRQAWGSLLPHPSPEQTAADGSATAVHLPPIACAV